MNDIEETRRLFDLYTSPWIEWTGILNILGTIQKGEGDGFIGDWKKAVNDLMEAMELHDAGMFPDEWWPDEEEANL